MLNLKYLRPIAVIAAVVTVVVAIGHFLLPAGDLLYRENGLLEDISVSLWIISVLLAAGTAFRVADPGSRLMAVWTGWMAALATLRELDKHIMLNPKYLGEYGVRYRVDWWFGSDASVWLRLGWAVVFIVVVGLAVYPPLRLRQRLWALCRQGDFLFGFLLMAVAFLFLGFVVDDILRPVHIVELGTKQLIEETSETIGALLYCAGMMLQWRRPL